MNRRIDRFASQMNKSYKKVILLSNTLTFSFFTFISSIDALIYKCVNYLINVTHQSDEQRV